MKNTDNWFDVDKEGLKQLQAGKPKHYLLRELIQNAWDENVHEVKVDMKFSNGVAIISVEDDNAQGFKDIKDSYTLYKETEKRKDPEKRGRFNLGEKQAFAICKEAKVETTKGTVIFNDKGRTENLDKKRKQGSVISVIVEMTQEEFDEMLEVINTYIIPEQVKFYVNGKRKTSDKLYTQFETRLATEIIQDNVMRKAKRVTKVNLYKKDKNFLYEMGIPIVEIECAYSIDIQQKVPLSSDRESVTQSYLRDVLCEVLNNTHEELAEADASQNWVREAMSDDRISQEAVTAVIEKRYGDKVCVADPFDKNSIDEAISNGYRVIRGNEMSGEEWGIVKKFKSLFSSSSLFGTSFVAAESVTPNKEQLLVAKYAKKIAKRLLGIDITVQFVKARDMVTAQYGSDTLTFNVAKLGPKFFNTTVSEVTTDLIVHELGHHAGNHTEMEYHNLITRMTGQLVMLALKEPEFFNFS